MRKIKISQIITGDLIDTIVCDTCGKIIHTCSEHDILRLSTVDTNYEFCDYKCLNNFVNAEIKKEN